MKRHETSLVGLLVLRPDVQADARGWIAEGSSDRETFIRSKRGVLRGLHYSVRLPHDRFLRATAGEVFAACVDLRRGSRSFGRYAATLLSAENKLTLFVPRGMAVGFYAPVDAEVLVRRSDAAEDERGIAWNDPEVGIPWPLVEKKPILSAQDEKLPWLAAIGPEDLPT